MFKQLSWAQKGLIPLGAKLQCGS